MSTPKMNEKFGWKSVVFYIISSAEWIVCLLDEKLSNITFLLSNVALMQFKFTQKRYDLKRRKTNFYCLMATRAYSAVSTSSGENNTEVLTTKSQRLQS